MRTVFLLILHNLQYTLALEAKWTAASDGGPARFSKKWRDANGIDDSQWVGDGSASNGVMNAFIKVLPDSASGWLITMIATSLCLLFFWLGRKEIGPQRTGHTTGGAPESERQHLNAAEAARAAALRRNASR